MPHRPEPWRATRWAWFWLITPPVGPIVFLLLSGPGNPVAAGPEPTPDRGWGFLLGIAFSAVLPVWWLS